MDFNDKMKTIHNKIDQYKHQCYLDRPAAQISTLSSVYVDKYEYLSGKLLLEKAAKIKRFEYLLFGNELQNWRCKRLVYAF